MDDFSGDIPTESELSGLHRYYQVMTYCQFHVHVYSYIRKCTCVHVIVNGEFVYHTMYAHPEVHVHIFDDSTICSPYTSTHIYCSYRFII